MAISADTIRGWVDLIVLSILNHEDSYGYAISQRISDATAGEYRLKETTLYTALKRLETQGLIASEKRIGENGRARTYYAITDEGRLTYGRRCDEWHLTRRVLNQFVPEGD